MNARTVEERYLDLGCGTCRYLETGAGPPLLLLHGMGLFTSANTFDLLLPHLAPRFRLLAPDLLGFGKGTRQVTEGPTFELILDHLREFLDRLGIETTHVVGHSLGGWLGGLLAYQSPQRVDRLVLLCAAGLNRDPAKGIRVERIPTAAEIETMVTGDPYWLRDPARVAEADVARMVAGLEAAAVRPGALTSLDSLLHQMQVPELRERYLLHRRLPHTRVPTLMAWGEGDVMDPYPTWSTEFEALGGDMTRSAKPWVVPGARFARLPTGHFPHCEMPAQTADLIASFLES